MLAPGADYAPFLRSRQGCEGEVPYPPLQHLVGLQKFLDRTAW